MNYKEIKQHNRKETKLYWASWDDDACDWTYKKNYIDLYKYVTEEATSEDDYMTKKDRCLFHAINPNGLIAQLPSTDDFEYIDNPETYSGAYQIYSKWSNHHARKIRKFAFASKSSYTMWEVDYHISRLEKDLNECKKLMVEKNLVGSLAA